MANIGFSVRIDARPLQALVGDAKARNLTLKAVRAGIKVLVAPAKAGAPRRKGSGALKAAQGWRAGKGRRGKTISWGVQGARVRVERMFKGRVVKPHKYDHLVQGGTRPHRLGKGEKLARLFRRRKGDVMAPGTKQDSGKMHPGSKPNPYRRRMFAMKKGAMAATIVRTLKQEIDKLLAKQAAKGTP
jgi:hypothetical protein